jgi:hypothetical protein
MYVLQYVNAALVAFSVLTSYQQRQLPETTTRGNYKRKLPEETTGGNQ